MSSAGTLSNLFASIQIRSMVSFSVPVQLTVYQATPETYPSNTSPTFVAIFLTTILTLPSSSTIPAFSSNSNITRV